MAGKKRQAVDHPPALGKALGEDQLLPLAQRVTRATQCPVVGSVAVILHGGGRTTRDIDIFSSNFWETHQRLEAHGILWNSAKREHVIDDVPVRLVPADSLGGEPERLTTIKGVLVVGLADIIRAKLAVGLEHVHRSKHIAHVIDLIERIPLKKDFAAKLPTKLRAPFKELVEQVHGPRRTTIGTLAFWKKYA